MKKIEDTSKSYDDFVGFISEENLSRGSLRDFLGDKTEYKPPIKEKEIDRDFPDDWQKIMVNFETFEDYFEFMELIGSKPIPKLNFLVYEQNSETAGILGFLGE